MVESLPKIKLPSQLERDPGISASPRQSFESALVVSAANYTASAAAQQED